MTFRGFSAPSIKHAEQYDGFAAGFIRAGSGSLHPAIIAANIRYSCDNTMKKPVLTKWEPVYLRVLLLLDLDIMHFRRVA